MVTIELRLVGENWTRSRPQKVRALSVLGTHEFVFDVRKDARVIAIEHRCAELFPEWRLKAHNDELFGCRYPGDQYAVKLTIDGNWIDSGVDQ